jgi:hypothetical protein
MLKEQQLRAILLANYCVLPSRWVSPRVAFLKAENLTTLYKSNSHIL